MLLKARGYFAVLLAAVAVAACSDDSGDLPAPAGGSGGGSGGAAGSPSGGAAGSTGGGTSGAAGSSGGSATGGSSGTGGGGTAGTAGSAGSSSSGGSGGSVTDYVVGACRLDSQGFAICADYAFVNQTDADEFKADCVISDGVPLDGCDMTDAVASCVWNTVEYDQPIRKIYYGTWDLTDVAKGCGENRTWTVY